MIIVFFSILTSFYQSKNVDKYFFSRDDTYELSINGVPLENLTVLSDDHNEILSLSEDIVLKETHMDFMGEYWTYGNEYLTAKYIFDDGYIQLLEMNILSSGFQEIEIKSNSVRLNKLNLKLTDFIISLANSNTSEFEKPVIYTEAEWRKVNRYTHGLFAHLKINSKNKEIVSLHVRHGFR